MARNALNTGSPDQSPELIRLAKKRGIMTFPSREEEPYCTILRDGHFETWPLDSNVVRRWLEHLYFSSNSGDMPSKADVNEAIRNLVGEALFDSDESHEIHRRVASEDDALYLDLANSAWEAVEVTQEGWRVIDDPPVKFVRSATMQPLPHPEEDGSLQLLDDLMNTGPEENNDIHILNVGWLLAALKKDHPFPIRIFTGEPGSAKSMTTRFLKKLIDPAKPLLRASLNNEEDLQIAARHNHLLGLDNQSDISRDEADALCRLATGTGFGTRQFHTNTQEVVFEARRPIVVNGVGQIATQNDLINRALISELPPVPEDDRQREKVLWSRFRERHGAILGVLLDALSAGLRHEDEVDPPELPRMADAAHWISACETALPWDRGRFLTVHERQKKEALGDQITQNPVGQAILELLDEGHDWEGSATDLKSQLEDEGHAEQHEEWPASASVFGKKLKEAAPWLRNEGYKVKQRHTGTSRVWILEGPSEESPEEPPIDAVNPVTGVNAENGRAETAPTGS